MKKVGSEKVGNLTHTDYFHIGDDGRKKITTVTSEDVAPVIQKVKKLSQSVNSKDAFRYKATVSVNMINEACRQAAISWGVRPHQALGEIMAAKTDRSKKLWRTLTEGRDFRKMQARAYQ